MLNLISLIIFILVLYCLIFNNQYTDNNNLINNNNLEFYLYYTNWCGYSKRFLSNVWPDLEKNLNKLNINYHLIDGDKNKQNCIDNNIRGFPTLLFKKNNRSIEYEGNHNLDDILHFIKSIN